jgi:hypothetical protein
MVLLRLDQPCTSGNPNAHSDDKALGSSGPSTIFGAKASASPQAYSE